MFQTLTTPRFLMGTSAIATVALGVMITQQIPLNKSPTLGPVSLETDPVTVDATQQSGRTLTADGEIAAADDTEIFAAADPVTLAEDADVALPSQATPAPVAKQAPIGGLALRRTDQPQAPAGSAAPQIAEGAIANQGLRLERRRLSATTPQQGLSAAEADQLGGLSDGSLLQEAPADPFIAPQESSTEEYPQTEPNPLKLTAEEPVSTFSIDVDTASYAVVRSSLTQGYMPPRDAVRIEEMVNYFDYAYPAPETREVPFATSVSVAETPWNPDTQLLHIGIQGYDLPADERPPLNLVFLIDTSGSMNDPAKLPLLIRSFSLLLDTLQADDEVAIVTYAGSAGLALEATKASDRTKILNSLRNLSAGGSTAGQAGLQQAYQVAEDMAAEGEISRVILATDGDFNVGINSPKALEDFIADKRDSGTYLSVLGFGRGNYNDSTMQSLAQNGNGTAAYIDTLAEAQKVLVEETSGALFPIAGDVKIQIEFNPAQISEYRLIGYETRALNREDFNNDAVDAGEIGAGHTVTAIYEITPKGSPAERIGDLRYAQTASEEADPSAEYAFLKLRYKLPGEDRSKLIETPILPDRQDIAADETGFAASVAGFGLLLRGGTEISGWGHDDALALASASRGDDPFGYRAEFLNLVRLAKVAQ